jgi:membrane protein YdbS with pleckstrin-like domain
MFENPKPSDCIYFSSLHWIIFCVPGLMLLGSLALAFYMPILRQLGFVLAAFATCWIIITLSVYYFSSLTIQKNSVILRMGFLVRQTIDIPLNKIETIDIRQTIFGSLFHYGTLVITGTGGTKHYINYLQKPLTCRRYIEQLMGTQQ